MNDFKILRFNCKLYVQLFRYGIVGILSNIFGYLLYLFLTSAGYSPKLTMTALYGTGAVIGFLFNKQLTFSYRGSILESGIRYGIMHIFGYLLNLLIMVIYVDIYRYPHTIVQGIAIFLVAGFLFLSFKFFVFRSIL
jgi:putative flippase GtrA